MFFILFFVLCGRAAIGSALLSPNPNRVEIGRQFSSWMFWQAIRDILTHLVRAESSCPIAR
jgi:hypothetical protein